MKKITIGLVCVLSILVASSSAEAIFTQTLKYGMTNNSEVQTLQELLISKGYLKGAPNGSIYQTTKNAIIAFQKANNLTADGIVGMRTREVLNRINTPSIIIDPHPANLHAHKCGFNVTSPLPSSTVTFPLTVSGYLDYNSTLGCSWRTYTNEAGGVDVQRVSPQGSWQSTGVAQFVILGGGPVYPYNPSNPPTFSFVIPSSVNLPVSGSIFRLVFTEAGDQADVPESWDVIDQMAIKLIRQ